MEVANMTIHIFENPVIDPQCLTDRLHTPFRNRIREHNSLDKLKRVVSDNHVIEIGCGVFGGLAEKALEFGCKSYRGVDISIGNKEESVPECSLDQDRISRNDLPCEISIPEHIADDSRVEYFFGIDAYTFFSDYVETESVVTISTGFFHEAYLMPDEKGEEYVKKMIEQIARATIRGHEVGLHHFLLDRTPDINRYGADEGLTFRYFFKKCGIYPYGGFRPRAWLLGKPY
ncbi:MAG: hypothetical protein ACD_15C00150G0001 [uncultured bacterium]|nr:MAG: hypothetical protein ACD_15C00150G0001 [uncultured bacterium]